MHEWTARAADLVGRSHLSYQELARLASQGPKQLSLLCHTVEGLHLSALADMDCWGKALLGETSML